MRPVVLIADTDRDSRAELAAALSDYGVDIVEAEDADTAMRHFIERGPALVLIDVFLPRRGGVDFLRRLRAAEGGHDVSAIIICGVKGLSDLRDQAMGELDARAFLTKPLRRESLVKHLGLVLTPGDGDFCVAPPQSFFPVEAPPPRGDLDQYPFVLLFKQLCDTGYTGTLHLAHEKVQKAVYFVDGSVVFASSNRVAETLGRHMLLEGLITQEVYGEALDRLQSTGAKFGSILVDLGHLDQAGVEEAVKSHVVAKVTDVFSWPEGRYALGGKEPPPGSMPPGSIDCRRILWKGILESASMGEIFSLMKDSLDRYVVAKRDPIVLESEFELQENDKLYIEGARGFPGKTLQQVLSATGGEREMRLLLALFAMDVFATCGNPECNYVTDDDEGESMRRLVAARRTLAQMKSQNHFLVLGVSLEADDAVVRRSYQEKAKEFHPDILPPSAPQELKNLYSEIFLLLRNAYEKLEKSESRRTYLKSLKTGADSTFMEGARLLDAETSYQRGMSLFRKRLWAEALPHIEEALRLNPDEPEYLVQCGIAKMNLKDGDRAKHTEEAKRHFLRAAELDYRTGEPFYRLGFMYKMNGDAARALEYFQRALLRDPSHMQARLELRLLGSRKERGLKPVPHGKKTAK